MTDAAVEALIQTLPQLVVAGILVAGIVLVLRAFQTLRGDLERDVVEQVKTAVALRSSDLHERSVEVTKIRDQLSELYSSASKQNEDFMESISERQQQLDRRMEDVDKKLQELENVVPGTIERHALQRSDVPRSLLIRAQNATSWADAIDAVMAAANAEPGDVTSKDSEVAGDLARRFRKFNLARSLYERAVELDPDNLSAEVERLSLTIEGDHSRRTESLERAREIAVTSRDESLLARVSNALIELNRWRDLQQLCERVLETVGDDDAARPIVVQAQRDLAVALNRQHRPERARELFRDALSSDPENAGLIRAFMTTLLADRGFGDEAVALGKKLVWLDPTEASHWLGFADALFTTGDDHQALAAYQQARELAHDGTIEHVRAVMSINKLEGRAFLREQWGMSADSTGDGSDSEAVEGPAETTLTLEPVPDVDGMIAR